MPGVRRMRSAAAALTVAMAATLAGAPAQAGPQGQEQAVERPGRPVSVMTRNIYLGADINRPIRAATQAANAPGATPESILVALANATHTTRAIVEQTIFPRRSELLAAELAEVRPDVVGLQEVALWRSGPIQLDQVGVPNAEQVDADFLQILLDDLAEAGVEYRAVSIAQRADVEAPSFPGDLSTAFTQGSDVRMTMRDVILVRTGARLEITDEGQDVYDVNLPVQILGRELSFARGYNWVDLATRRGEVRVLNTHLEAFSSDIAYAQAAQLLAGPASHGDDTVLVCDCNSDPLNDSVKTGIGDRLSHQAPYELLTGPGGFTDAWLALGADDPGWTAGLSERVDDATPAAIDHRIDLVLYRAADARISADKGVVTGDDPEDRDDVHDLWPSDHAGVVVRLRGLR